MYIKHISVWEYEPQTHWVNQSVIQGYTNVVWSGHEEKLGVFCIIRLYPCQSVTPLGQQKNENKGATKVQSLRNAKKELSRISETG